MIAKTLTERVLLFLPIAAAIVAVAYDVGFFDAIDIAYFSAFSLSEHFVFAMEAYKTVFAMLGVTYFALMTAMVMPQAFERIVNVRLSQRAALICVIISSAPLVLVVIYLPAFAAIASTVAVIVFFWSHPTQHLWTWRGVILDLSRHLRSSF